MRMGWKYFYSSAVHFTEIWFYLVGVLQFSFFASIISTNNPPSIGPFSMLSSHRLVEYALYELKSSRKTAWWNKVCCYLEITFRRQRARLQHRLNCRYLSTASQLHILLGHFSHQVYVCVDTRLTCYMYTEWRQVFNPAAFICLFVFLCRRMDGWLITWLGRLG